jgi:hypothetical protein
MASIGKHLIPGTREENVSLMTLEQNVITALRTFSLAIYFSTKVNNDKFHDKYIHENR